MAQSLLECPVYFLPFSLLLPTKYIPFQWKCCRPHAVQTKYIQYTRPSLRFYYSSIQQSTLFAQTIHAGASPWNNSNSLSSNCFPVRKRPCFSTLSVSCTFFIFFLYLCLLFLPSLFPKLPVSHPTVMIHTLATRHQRSHHRWPPRPRLTPDTTQRHIFSLNYENIYIFMYHFTDLQRNHRNPPLHPRR